MINLKKLIKNKKNIVIFLIIMIFIILVLNNEKEAGTLKSFFIDIFFVAICSYISYLITNKIRNILNPKLLGVINLVLIFVIFILIKILFRIISLSS